MFITDTHTHLYLEQFEDDIETVINDAINVGVNKFFLPAISSKYNDSMINLKKKYNKNIFLMAGLHPCYVNKDFENEILQVEKLIKENEIVAVGEIGIDLYWDKSNLALQKEAFLAQIKIAQENDLPIVIHCRESFNEIYHIIKKENLINGIFHCFSGNLEQAKKITSLGLKLGIGGVLTFKNGGIDKFLHQINIENIVLETDSPYLSPTPLRGKRNESANLIHIAKKLSEIYNIPLSEIARITSSNSKSVFGV